MLWIKTLTSGSFLVLGTHILHFLAVLDISRFTTGDIGPQSRLYVICNCYYYNVCLGHSFEASRNSHDHKQNIIGYKEVICDRHARALLEYV